MCVCVCVCVCVGGWVGVCVCVCVCVCVTRQWYTLALIVLECSTIYIYGHVTQSGGCVFFWCS